MVRFTYLILIWLSSFRWTGWVFCSWFGGILNWNRHFTCLILIWHSSEWDVCGWFGVIIRAGFLCRTVSYCPYSGNATWFWPHCPSFRTDQPDEIPGSHWPDSGKAAIDFRWSFNVDCFLTSAQINPWMSLILHVSDWLCVCTTPLQLHISVCASLTSVYLWMASSCIEWIDVTMNISYP